MVCNLYGRGRRRFIPCSFPRLLHAAFRRGHGLYVVAAVYNSACTPPCLVSLSHGILWNYTSTLTYLVSGLPKLRCREPSWSFFSSLSVPLSRPGFPRYSTILALSARVSLSDERPSSGTLSTLAIWHIDMAL